MANIPISDDGKAKETRRSRHKTDNSPTEIRCTAIGRPSQEIAYLSITRADGTTERFNLTPTIARLYSVKFTELFADWGNVDDD